MAKDLNHLNELQIPVSKKNIVFTYTLKNLNGYLLTFCKKP